MRRVIALVGLLLLIPSTSVMAATCCKCAYASTLKTGTVCLTTDGGCATVIADAKNPKLSDLNCDVGTSYAAGTGICRLVSQGGACQEIADARTWSAGAQPEAVKTVSAIPLQLNTDIPGLRFAESIQETTCLDSSGKSYSCLAIPYLAQYVAAIYNYLLGIVLITAAVMIVWGGFKYVLSSTVKGVQDGKDVVKDAVIGLLLLFGIVTILQTINPATTNLNAVTVRVVSQEPFHVFANAQMTTTAETVSGAPGSAAGSATLTACPFTLSQPLLLKENLSTSENQKILKEWGMTSLNIRQDRRAQEFFQKVREFVKGKPIEERMSLIANAAVACGVHLMSCGETSGTIWELAGIGDNACLTVEGRKSVACYPGYGGCPTCNPYDNYFGRKKPGPKTATIIQITTGTQQATFNSLKCTNECGEKSQNLPGCIDDKGKAIAFVRAEMNKISDYPDKWLNDLKPGDVIQVYTGNSSCGGGHSALFFGWTSGGAAQVIQGEFGKKVTAGTLCIKKSCGDNMLPIVGIKKPIAAQ